MKNIVLKFIKIIYIHEPDIQREKFLIIIISQVLMTSQVMNGGFK